MNFFQLGTAFGLAITTIIYNQVRSKESASLGGGGRINNGLNDVALRRADLLAYRAAAWGAFSFGLLGKDHCVKGLYDLN
jgi:hypothetical protein